jgi:hypothetical protein
MTSTSQADRKSIFSVRKFSENYGGKITSVETVTGGVTVGKHERLSERSAKFHLTYDLQSHLQRAKNFYLAACTVGILVYRVEGLKEEVRYSDGMRGRAVAAIDPLTDGVAHMRSMIGRVEVLSVLLSINQMM